MSLTTIIRTTIARMMIIRITRTRTIIIIATRLAKKLPYLSLYKRNLGKMTTYA
jgi:hypothetical protein